MDHLQQTGTRGKTARWHKEKPHISKSFRQWVVKPAVLLHFRFGCLGNGGGKDAKACAPGLNAHCAIPGRHLDSLAEGLGSVGKKHLCRSKGSQWRFPS